MTRTSYAFALAASLLVSTGLALAAPPPSQTPRRLHHWSFDSLAPGTDFTRVEQVESVPGLVGQAARVHATGTTARLLCAPTPNGKFPALRRDAGTVRFAFRPDWSTAAGGPGAAAVLLQSGSNTSQGAWILRVNASGNALEFARHDGQKEWIAAQGTINWRSNEWYALALTYGPGGARWFTNGAPANAVAKPAAPAMTDPDDADPGLFVGSDPDGRAQARGSFDELETFDGPLDPALVEADLEGGLRAEVTVEPPQIRLRWRHPPGRPVTLSRRNGPSDRWTPLGRATNRWEWLDNAVETGRRYQYLLHPLDAYVGIRDRYLEAAIELPPAHDRGVALLVLDRTVVRPLRPELDALAQDLANEGWQVEQCEVPRHDDTHWSNNPPAIATVKDFVQAAWTRHQHRLRALYLIGHVPIPHTGSLRPDGHQSRPLPADGYYGDTVYGPQDWSDTATMPPIGDPLTGARGIGQTPGDGIFDNRIYPSAVEVGVGRVDFAGLSQLTGGSAEGEVRLLRRYLHKVAQYRRSRLTFAAEAAYATQPGRGSPSFYGLLRLRRNTSAWFGDDTDHLRLADCLNDVNPAGRWFGLRYGLGGYDAAAPGHPTLAFRTRDLANPNTDPRVAFYLIDGSFLGDWNTITRPDKNTLVKALLTPPESGLVAMWVRMHTAEVSFQSLALGDTFGEAWARLVSSIEVDDAEYGLGSVQLALLGDPTLRFFILPPVRDLRARRTGNTVRLAWNPDPLGSTPAAYVYRSTTGPNGPFQLLTPHPVVGNAFQDPTPPPTSSYYQVRPTRRETTGAGSFQNLGLGSQRKR